jgi:hypothetical protein
MECPETQAGTQASCPTCGKVATIPSPQALATATAAVPVAMRAAPDSADYVTRCYWCGDVVRVSEAWRMPFSFGQGLHAMTDCCGWCFRVQMWGIVFAVGVAIAGIAFVVIHHAAR